MLPCYLQGSWLAVSANGLQASSPVGPSHFAPHGSIFPHPFEGAMPEAVIGRLHRHIQRPRSRESVNTSDFRLVFERLAGTSKQRMCSDMSFEDWSDW